VAAVAERLMKISNLFPQWHFRMAITVALSSEGAKPSRFAVIATATVSITVAILVITLGLAQGFKDGFQAMFVGLNAHMTILPYRQDNETAEKCNICRDKQLLKETLGDDSVIVIADYASLNFNGVIKFEDSKNDTNLKIELRGISIVDGVIATDIDNFVFKSWPDWHEEFSLDAFFNSGNPPLALVTQNFRAIHIIRPGDEIEVFPEQTTAASSISRNPFKLNISSTFSSGLDFDANSRNLIFIPFDALKGIAKPDSLLVGCQVKFFDPKIATEKKVILQDEAGVSNCAISTWQEKARKAEEIIEAINWAVIFMVFFSSVLVVWMLMREMSRMVEKRRVAIALMIESGAQRSSIWAIFSWAGLLVWGVGTTIGSLCGLFGYYLLIPYVQSMFRNMNVPSYQTAYNFPGMVIIAVGVLIVIVLASIFSAVRASRVDVAKILAEGN
jgi:ABC-type lipoprotein release transport system permease subunit